MVNSAWDFEAINDRYRAAIDFLDQFQNQTREPTRQELDEWTARENSIWRAAIDSDPLIPGELHPSGYLGRRAWDHRQSVLAQAAHLAAKLC